MRSRNTTPIREYTQITVVYASCIFSNKGLHLSRVGKHLRTKASKYVFHPLSPSSYHLSPAPLSVIEVGLSEGVYSSTHIQSTAALFFLLLFPQTVFVKKGDRSQMNHSACQGPHTHTHTHKLHLITHSTDSLWLACSTISVITVGESK